MSASSPQPNYTSEVRFAVVMYGGVSLAIYINGIAQELLRMVRATAKPASAIPATGTERIYRKISYLLTEAKNRSPAESDPDDPQSFPPTRFVVDILSGTSAGGINGIFLAKALANGQDMEQLKDLWVTEGDIETLINDRRSIETPLSLQDPPPSLLNSERMYFELLKAFDGMDNAGGPRSETTLSPYIDELDLFVTSTDLQGVVLPIHLSDNLVYERRHRNVLHFVYSSPDVSGEDEPRNDFHAKYNPFLAYAARCTSSFPFAFEPMCLCDTDKILSRYKPYRNDETCKSGSARWQKFYRDYLNPEGVPGVPFPQRAFGDGGYLDNKPFGYATEMLMKRGAPVPVDRKLLYIEPSPEHPEDEVDREQKPDAIDNVVLALLTLPRYETIREDLQRVLERNRLVERVNRIIAGVDRDYSFGQAWAGGSDREWGLPEAEIAKLDLAEMARRNGPSYAAYHRLRIASVTDDLAKLVTRVAGFDEDSGYFLVVRNLVQAWRDLTYVEHRRDHPTKPTLNQFLFHFDLAHPTRRLNYVRRQIDVLYSLDKGAAAFIEACSKTAPESESEKLAFRRALLNEKQAVNDAFVMLRHAMRTLRARPLAKEQTTQTADSSVSKKVLELAAEIKRVIANEFRATQPAERTPESLLLDYFLAKRVAVPYDPTPARDPEQDENETGQRARTFLEQHTQVKKLFDETAQTLQANVIEVKDELRQRLLHLTSGTGDGNTSIDPQTFSAQRCVGHYFEDFEDYDLVTYPILYDTDVGEADMIDVIRVSPEDAKQLINEETTGCHKLAGTALAHFGAFLQKLWRQNDILWGRLDGTERIITSLIPDHPDRARLIGEAQAEIICETLGGMEEKERFELLAETLMRTRTRKADPQLLSDFINRLKANCAHNPTLSKKLEALIDTEDLREHYRKTFKTHHQVEPEGALRSAARATTVIGKMLEGLSERRRVSSKYAAWIARVGQIFWALVEVAVPRSFFNLFFRHFLKLLYFLEALMIAGSTVLVMPDVQKFALTAFGVTAAIHLAAVILGDLMQSRNRLVTLAKIAGGAGLIVLIVLGVVTLSGILGVNGSWNAISLARSVVQKYSPIGQPSKKLIVAVFSGIFFLPFLWSIRGDVLGFLQYMWFRIRGANK